MKDTRGLYSTKEKCKIRVIEIIKELPLTKPRMQPRGYLCDEV